MSSVEENINKQQEFLLARESHHSFDLKSRDQVSTVTFCEDLEASVHEVQ